MITGHHPVVQMLAECDPWEFTLIGSRFIGVHDDRSDYDFYAGTRDYSDKNTLGEWLAEQGFSREHNGGYGPDRHMDLWRCETAGHPHVDVLVCTAKEVRLRLDFLYELRKLGNDRGGKFQETQKHGASWPALWDTLRALAHS